MIFYAYRGNIVLFYCSLIFIRGCTNSFMSPTNAFAGGSTDILLPFFPCYMHSGGWFARVRGGGLAGSENLPEMAGWRLSALGALFYQVLFCLSTLLRRSVFLLIDPN
jgi:hypothetical protein